MTFPATIKNAVDQLKNGTMDNVEDVKIGDIIISALNGVSCPSSLSVTRKPIAAGYAISDAAVDIPLEITLEICIADPQMTADELLAAAISGDLSLSEKWQDKSAHLAQTMDNREIVTVQTHDSVYDNMLISAIDPAYDVDSNYDCWFGTVNLTQIITSSVGVGNTGIADSVLESVGGL